MKKLLFTHILIFSFLISYSQGISTDQIKKRYSKFTPSNIDPNKLNPSDIPSEEVLRQMGFSDREIEEALKFKNGEEKYDKNTTDKDTSNVAKFYLYLNGDTLKKDSILFPKAKIFGQDIFRSNKLNYYQKALDAKAPENYKIGRGDEVSVSIWGYNDFSETLEVDERGYIHPSSYGRIYVKGLKFKKMR